jgi:tetratricopeptide (TPR) repeat protein
LYDAHDPYDPPPPFKKRFASDPYDGEIAYADSEVGKLLTALRTLNLYDGTLIAVMSDHGEAFGEHGERTHGVFLYDETIHVPLLFKLPAAGPGGRRIETRAGLVDVAPTILRVCGIPIPKVMQGQALLEAGPAKVAMAPRQRASKKAHGASKQAPARSQESKEPLPDRPVYAETDYPHRAFGWSPLRSLRAGKYLYIQAPEREVYDQSADPQATRNLAPEAKAVTETLALQLEEFRRKTSQSLVALAKPDPEQVQKLQALGYVASDTTTPAAGENNTAVDPKGKIEVANLLHFAMLDVEDGRYSDAIPKLERVVAEQPEMPVAQMQLGIAQSRLKNYQKALAPLQKAVELRPDSGMGHYELGLALFETGDWKAAAPEFEAAVARAPRWADAHFSLAAVYARIDRVPDAMQELDTTLGLNADHYRANLLRGRILSLQNNAAAALTNLEKAVQVQPDSREAHLFLADAYEQLGRNADAQRERAAAQRLGSPATR